jgi:hypothetical protein
VSDSQEVPLPGGNVGGATIIGHNAFPPSTVISHEITARLGQRRMITALRR